MVRVGSLRTAAAVLLSASSLLFAFPLGTAAEPQVMMLHQ
jgi:hypothetical protein